MTYFEHLKLWEVALEAEGYLPQRQAGFRREIARFLTRCSAAQVPPSAPRAKAYIEAEERLGNRAVRPALRWLFHYAARVAPEPNLVFEPSAPPADEVSASEEIVS